MGAVAAGWWLFVALVALALVFSAHFVGADREAPIRDIYAVYDNPVWGMLALVVFYALLLGLVALFVTALRALLARRARA